MAGKNYLLEGCSENERSFQLLDDSGQSAGSIVFDGLSLDESHVNTPWGRFQTQRPSMFSSKVIVLQGGIEVARIGINQLMTKIRIEFSSGQEVIFRRALFGLDFKSKSEVGTYFVRTKVRRHLKSPPSWTIEVCSSVLLRPESVLMALALFLGFNYLSASQTAAAAGPRDR